MSTPHQKLTRNTFSLPLGKVPALVGNRPGIPFDQAKEALAYLEKGRAKGEVAVQLR